MISNRVILVRIERHYLSNLLNSSSGGGKYFNGAVYNTPFIIHLRGD